jgi:FemAB-related protein (PEP-CTERM system-associated)
MEIKELQDQDRARWDEFVSRSKSGCFFHLSGWKSVMESTFQHQTHFLFAEANHRIVGILPLLRVKNLLRGYYLTSFPGGLCAEHAEAANALIERAIEMCKDSQDHYLILRDSQQQWERPEFTTNTEHCTLIVSLDPDPGMVWKKFKKRARQLTNKAIKAGLIVNIGLGLLEEFYPIYSRSMAKKGTPTLGLKFFQRVAQQFPTGFNLFVVCHCDQIIGGGFVFYHKDTIYCSWGGMLREYYDLNPNHLLYWQTMKHGCESGYRRLDLGRSARNSGTYTFKMNWGAEPQLLHQQCYLSNNSKYMIVGYERMQNPGYRLLVKVWSYLPLWLTDPLGPRLRRHIPFG